MNNYVKNLKLESFPKITFCPSCAYGKQTKSKFPTSKGQKEKFMLDLMHSNVSRLMQIESHSGFKHFLTFIDDKSRKSYVYFMKYKSEVFEYFKIYKTKAKPF
jgi:5'-3' exoribonuclease 2